MKKTCTLAFKTFHSNKSDINFKLPLEWMFEKSEISELIKIKRMKKKSKKKEKTTSN